MNRLTKKDLTLLVLTLAEGKPMTPVQLQKSVFLLQMRLPHEMLPAEGYEFSAYNYGPFTSEVYSDALRLAAEEAVAVNSSSYGKYSEYSATEIGRELGTKLTQELPQEAVSKAQEIIDWVRKQSFSGLVSAIYAEFPDYKANSVFRG